MPSFLMEQTSSHVRQPVHFSGSIKIFFDILGLPFLSFITGSTGGSLYVLFLKTNGYDVKIVRATHLGKGHRVFDRSFDKLI
jgi:hypothetical protein